MKVYDNGKLVGQTGSRSYLCWEREPGLTIIVGEVVPVYGGVPTQSQVELMVQPENVHYIIQHMRLSIADILTFKNWDPLNRSEILDGAKGKKALKKCMPPRDPFRP